MTEEGKKLTEEEFVVQAIKKLRKDPYRGIHSVYSGFNEAFRKYFDNITLPKFDANQVIEKLQGQIDRLQQRLDQMEKHIDKAPDKSQKSDPGSAASDTPKSSKKAKSLDDEPI